MMPRSGEITDDMIKNLKKVYQDSLSQNSKVQFIKIKKNGKKQSKKGEKAF